jgi:hypothetical protein
MKKSVEYIIRDYIRQIIAEAPAKPELDNAPAAATNSPFTPAEEKFISKFDANGTRHIGIIYSPTDIGIREFITRSGKDLNLTPEILLRMIRDNYIKIVPYTGYGRNTDYTLELQLSLDDIKGMGSDEQTEKEEKGSTSSAPAGEPELPIPGPENAGTILYGDLLQESAKIMKTLLSEKKKTEKKPEVKVYHKQARVLNRLPKGYITYLEKIIDILDRKTKSKFEKERLVADLLDNLSINLDLNADQIKKSYEFHRSQKRFNKFLDSK